MISSCSEVMVFSYITCCPKSKIYLRRLIPCSIVGLVFLIQSCTVKHSSVRTRNKLMCQMRSIVDREARPAVCTVYHVSKECRLRYIQVMSRYLRVESYISIVRICLVNGVQSIVVTGCTVNNIPWVLRIIETCRIDNVCQGKRSVDIKENDMAMIRTVRHGLIALICLKLRIY